ncbi:hypothetical protein NC652_003279 [Populus alba x Populus x berolinensis]|nr:hypothetical protein NC652_003279 [Populus alba x Populus x berolinensis]
MGRMECVDPCKFWSALDQHEQGQFLEAFQLLDTRKGRGMLLHVISGVRRHDNVNQSDNLQYFLVSNLLKKMGDIALLKDAIQMETVFNCFKRVCGSFLEGRKRVCKLTSIRMTANIMHLTCCCPYIKFAKGLLEKLSQNWLACLPDNLKQLAQEMDTLPGCDVFSLQPCLGWPGFPTALISTVAGPWPGYLTNQFCCNIEESMRHRNGEILDMMLGPSFVVSVQAAAAL